MKKIILGLLAIVFVINIASAQGEKVGINTLTPDETLHVIGDIILLESPDGSKKIMMRTAGGDGELKSLGDLYLRAQGNDIILNHVPTDGNVGIGTITAPEKLTVEGAIKVGTSGNMTSDEGTLKFESGDFLGFDGTTWKSLTSGGTGPWIENGSNVYYLGSVGVNTTSPTADFHVVGDSLLLQSADGTKNLLFRNAGADSEVKSIGDLYLRGQNSDVIINHIASDGNVGIGTGAPVEQLDINGGVRIGTTITDNSGTIRFEGGDFEGYDGTVWKSLTSGGSLWNENSGDLYFSSGNVGIGTSVPAEKLEVEGNIQLSGSDNEILFDNTLNIRSFSQDSTVVLISPSLPNSNGSSTVIFGEDDNATFGMGIRYLGIPNDLEIFGKANTTEIGPHLVMNRNTGNTFFESSVRIGGSNIFPVGYKFAVDGKIICEELQVQLVSTWPDYVFEDSYPLMSLSNIKSFIKEHKHLPGIPSAQEVENVGLSIGEMQKKMMEKIEELTLHLIRLDEENKRLEDRLENIDHQISNH